MGRILLNQICISIFSLLLVQTTWAGVQPQIPDKLLKSYKVFEIEMARFSDQDRRNLLTSAYGLSDSINQIIIGQDYIGNLMQARLVQYLETIGSRTGEPIALHQIGVPGIGKSAILKVLANSGIPMLRVDAQDFVATDQPEQVAARLYYILQQALKAQTPKPGQSIKPFILLVDELDKVPEVQPNGYITQPLIGVLNQILVDGKVSAPGGYAPPLDVSNAFIVTAMNLSPKDIQAFVKEALKGEDKNFWDFTEGDLKALDEWLRPTNQSPSALAKVLSRFFRDNTITRLLPDAVIAKPLYGEDFDKIVALDIKYAAARFTGNNNSRGLYIEHTDAFEHFLRSNTVFAPSGARMNVKAAQMLTEQLLGYAMRMPVPGSTAAKDPTLSRPRQVTLDYDDQKQVALVTINPLIKKGTQTISKGSFKVEISYDPVTRSFTPPKGLALDIPLPKEAEEKLGNLRKVTTTEILAKRFPPKVSGSKNLAHDLDHIIFGQEHLSSSIEESVNAYLATHGEATKLNYEILAGFTGIGKTQMVYEVGELLGLKVIRFNLQDYSDTQATSAESFAENLNSRLRTFRQTNPNKPYIILFEELDKINEIDPRTGAIIDRPVISHLKDLLNEGHKEIVLKQDHGPKAPIDLDIRDAFVFITLNLPTEIFGFQADPRLTTHQDMERAYRRLSTSEDELRKTLTKLFRDETVNRLMSPRFHIAKPLTEAHYKQIIGVEEERFTKTRLMDEEGLRNTAAIKLHFSPRFHREYMINEGVIPSEGGRQAAEAFRSQLQAQIEKAIGSIPKSSVISKVPFDLYLDYAPRSPRKPPRIIAVAKYTDKKSGKVQSVKLMDAPVTLRFPRLTAYGNIPDERILISIHEFGHAFTAALLGHRFEWVTVVPPSSGTGGLFKYPYDEIQEHTAQQMIAKLYSGLGSRAMERIFLSANPESENSVLDITSGASSDIEQTTNLLYDLIYSLGFNPKGGTIHRSGLDGGNYSARPAFFSELPSEQVEQLGKLLRNIENQLIKYLLEAHPREWYGEKIVQLARVGGMDEEEFYKLIEYKYPGPGTRPVGEESSLRLHFADVMVPENRESIRARQQQHGSQSKTAQASLQAALDTFVAFLNAGVAIDPNSYEKKVITLPDVTSNGHRIAACSDLLSHSGKHVAHQQE